jgi:hypothetical protein
MLQACQITYQKQTKIYVILTKNEKHKMVEQSEEKRTAQRVHRRRIHQSKKELRPFRAKNGPKSKIRQRQNTGAWGRSLP